MVALERVRHEYDGSVVLDLPRFVAGQGEQWLVLGQSGSGKTTLLHILAGLLRPTAGTVEVGGQDLRRLTGAALDRFRGAHIGIVFQRMHLLPTLTLEQNLLLAQYMAGLAQDRARVRAVLERLGIGHKQRSYPEQASAGEQQRAAIARAVINRPSIVLADEPTSSLDDVHAERVIGLLTEQARECEATLVVSTHDRRIKERLPNRLTLDRQAPTETGAGRSA